jgi:hypothetical protein
MRVQLRRPPGTILPFIATLLLALGGALEARAATILFVGNSFTFGAGSPVRYYRAPSVTDLNGSGVGGVPALFKSFTVQADLPYDVSVETHPGIGLEWHLEHELPVIGQHPWDAVVLQSYSTLDPDKPGDPTQLISAVAKVAAVLRAKNPAVEIRLTSTWPRADQVYDRHGAWYGKSVEVMAHDLRAGYDAAAKATPGIKAVVGVGDAWIRAMHEGFADANPYDGIMPDKIDLWTFDHYHASSAGYYLEALMLFGNVTGRDPRWLGETECSGFELGLSMAQVLALQKLAAEQLTADGVVISAPPKPAKVTKSSKPGELADEPVRCGPLAR